ncbi:MAG TPA: hypothetical protein EYP14_06990 [Planctomycetaceae bacterium]|nr:hypothetical protein [Planctomycetaceae bacterium]
MTDRCGAEPVAERTSQPPGPHPFSEQRSSRVMSLSPPRAADRNRGAVRVQFDALGNRTERAVTARPEEIPRDVDQLAREKGVTAVLNLQTDEDIANLAIDWETILSRYAGVGIDLHRVPIRDFDAKSLELHLPAAVGCLARLLQQGHTVLVHCNAGAGRSPSVVVAYLHWVEGWDLLEAEAFLQSCRPCSPDLNAIRAASDRWPPEESDPAGPETGQ